MYVGQRQVASSVSSTSEGSPTNSLTEKRSVNVDVHVEPSTNLVDKNVDLKRIQSARSNNSSSSSGYGSSNCRTNSTTAQQREDDKTNTTGKKDFILKT